MFNSDDEFIMEFKAEERKTQPTVIDIDQIDSDTSTISASEVDSDCSNIRTPPLLCKLKKPRVLIKKLPRAVLAKYNLNSKKTPPSSSLRPSRSSGRIKDKRIPVGKYLSLHVNKPLNEVLNKKEKLKLQQIKALRKETAVKEMTMSQNKKTAAYNLKPNKKLNDNEAAVRTVHHSKTQDSFNRTSLHERIAATRLKSHFAVSPLSGSPDVVIRKYFPSNTLWNAINPIVFNEASNIPLRNTPQGNIKVSTSETTNASVIQPIGTTSLLHTKTTQSSHAFPTFMAPAPQQQIPGQPMLLEAPRIASGVVFQQQINPTPRTFTIQSFKMPNDLSAIKSAAVINSPKVLIIDKPSLEADPLEMTSYNTAYRRDLLREQVSKGNNTHTDNECVQLESDLEVSDTEKTAEPEVIKRIIYHSKSVQTKFTCSSSICGLVDSDGFNLNCFYCYEIFPLHKWLEFKEHVKLLHHVEERENESDTDDITNSKSRNYPEKSSCQDFNVSKNMHTPSKNITNKENFGRKFLNDSHKVCKKLPLEPRLTGQCVSKAPKDPSRSLLKSNNSKQLNQSIVSAKSCRTQMWKDYKSSCNDEIINLDTDDCDSDNNVTEVAKSNLNSRGSQINGVKLVLPTLPHISIKKVDQLLPKESLNTKKSVSDSPSLNRSLIKKTDLNIQKCVKTLSKPASQQLSEKGTVKPRYFVVKRIIKLPTTGAVPNSEKGNTKSIHHSDMASNRENEDSVPKPTNGCGIVFGVTNAMVVVEFLLKLKTFPELWRSQYKNSAVYNKSIKIVCSHLNNRFELNITESEMRLSIQRVKDWYRSMVTNMYEHKKKPKKNEPHKEKFPIYFKILHNFLASEFQYAISTCLSSQLQSTTNKDKEISNETASKQKICRLQKVSKADKLKYQLATPITKESESTTMDNNKTADINTESLIEFDADTLYDNESSDEEVLKEFDETNFSKKTMPQIDGQKKKRTKTYLGSYECDLCRTSFKRICDLKRHHVMHFPPQFECALCSHKFYFKCWAERCAHIRNKKFKKVEHGDNTDITKPKKIWPKKIFRYKMICEICGSSYRSIGSLNTHKRDKHLNERHKCVVCNFSALSNWRIVQHQKKRHIVELGTIEEIAKKSRMRVETKTRFSNEARQEFLWRREMRLKLKPGEIFYGCCKCRILFNSRKEKVLHNKIEHPITETTVVCLLCLPNKLLLSNSNSARRHYTDIHKVAWHEIDALVKRTKPIFKLLSKDEIELLKASANYKELLEELLEDKKVEPAKNIILEDETIQAVQNLTTSSNIKEVKEDDINIAEECSQEENVCVDGIIDHDYDCEEVLNDHEYANTNGPNSNKEKEFMGNFKGCDEMVDAQAKTELYSNHTCDDEIEQLAYDIERSDNKTHNYIQNDHEYTQSIDYFVDGELVEESIIVEEYIDEVVEEGEYF